MCIRDSTCTPIGNSFTLPPGEARDKQLAAMKQWIDISAELGSPAIRTFAGSVQKGSTEDEARKFCIETLNICLDHAAKRGVFPVSYTHLRAHETPEHLVCRLLLEKK